MPMGQPVNRSYINCLRTVEAAIEARVVGSRECQNKFSWVLNTPINWYSLRLEDGRRKLSDLQAKLEVQALDKHISKEMNMIIEHNHLTGQK